MKKMITLLMAIGMLAMASGAMAADTTTVAVSATVTGTCKFTAGGTLSFTLDPSAGGNVNGTVTQPTFWCTKGATYTISDNDGLNKSGTTHRMKHATLTEYVPYSFTYTTTGTGTGKSAAITMNIASTVLEADYIDASAGNYADTVTMSITP